MSRRDDHNDAIRTGAEWLIHALEAEGVDTLFGYPGGAIMPAYEDRKSVV